MLPLTHGNNPMEWLLCNCGLPAGLEPGATDSAPEEFDEGLEEERQDRRDRRCRRGDGADRAVAASVAARVAATSWQRRRNIYV